MLQRGADAIGTIDKVPFPDLSAQRQWSEKAPSAKRHFTDNKISDGRKNVNSFSKESGGVIWCLKNNKLRSRELCFFC